MNDLTQDSLLSVEKQPTALLDPGPPIFDYAKPDPKSKPASFLDVVMLIAAIVAAVISLVALTGCGGLFLILGFAGAFSSNSQIASVVIGFTLGLLGIGVILVGWYVFPNSLYHMLKQESWKQPRREE